jgi:N-hydroxyarylamine O-acetyltransferase
MSSEHLEEQNLHPDLDAYLHRIGYSGDLRPMRQLLERLHLAHVTHIPFENLDILLKRPIRLDIGSLQAKLVVAGRGGYCFEQNGLFAAVLRELGFSVTNLAARVHYRTTHIRPRTHRTSLVEVDGERLLVDVGFGASGPFVPVPLDGARVSSQFAWSYRVMEREGLHFLQSMLAGEWTDLYSFSLDPQLETDYEMANYYVSTFPESPFVKALTVQKRNTEARHTLRGTEYTLDHGSVVTKRHLSDITDLGAFITATFGMELPEGYQFELGEAGVQVRATNGS